VLPRRASCAGSAGLTLVEVTIAIAIVAVLFSAVVVGVGALTGTKAKATAGQLAGTIRSLYDTAALSGKTCRMAFELQPAGKRTKYWAECAEGNVTANPDADEYTKKRARDDASRRRKPARKAGTSDVGPGLFPETGSTFEDVMSREKDRVEAVSRFSVFTSPEIEARELPEAVTVSVWTRHQRDVIKSGLAYIYFFPQGFTERAQVWVRQGNNVWTLTLAPLTGKTVVVGDELEVPRT
jgi:general secretion pathway protein H